MNNKFDEQNDTVKFQFVYVILNGQNFLDSIEDYCLTKLNYNEYH